MFSKTTHSTMKANKQQKHQQNTKYVFRISKLLENVEITDSSSIRIVKSQKIRNEKHETRKRGRITDNC